MTFIQEGGTSDYGWSKFAVVTPHDTNQFPQDSYVITYDPLAHVIAFIDTDGVEQAVSIPAGAAPFLFPAPVKGVKNANTTAAAGSLVRYFDE